MEKILQQAQFQVNYNDDKCTKASLEVLPDEVLLFVLSYLDIADIFRAFHELNQRFVNLIYESARYMTLLQNTTNAWLEQYMPQLQDRIKIINLNDNYLEHVFTNQWSFPNLRLINFQGNGWLMSLRLGEELASVVVMSSLNFLQRFGFSIKTFSNDSQNDIIHYMGYSEIVSCSFIERLSIDVCNARNVVLIQSYTPNLIHLKINRLTSPLYNINLPDTLNFITRTTRLTKLDITTDKQMKFSSLKQVIKSCETSLTKLVLVVNSIEPIDGQDIEALLKTCEQLEKFVFLIKLYKKIYMDGCERSFQTEWWLDGRRPPVYIQQNHDDSTIIVSMPCQFLFDFENNLYKWYINKGDQYSSFVRFTNINKIHFTNKIHQLFNLQYLYFVDRVFTSPYQSLQFDHCNIESKDTAFELLMDDLSMASILPNVNHFIIGSSNTFCSLILSIWILMTPNLRKLDISKLHTFNKIIMAKELTEMIHNDERLKPSFDHISNLIIFSTCDYVDARIKNELPLAFQKVFINAVIC